MNTMLGVYNQNDIKQENISELEQSQTLNETNEPITSACFICNICADSFTTPYSLLKHNRNHLTEIVTILTSYWDNPHEIKCEKCLVELDNLPMILNELKQMNVSIDNELDVGKFEQFNELVKRIKLHKNEVLCILYQKVVNGSFAENGTSFKVSLDASKLNQTEVKKKKSGNGMTPNIEIVLDDFSDEEVNTNEDKSFDTLQEKKLTKKYELRPKRTTCNVRRKTLSESESENDTNKFKSDESSDTNYEPSDSSLESDDSAQECIIGNNILMKTNITSKMKSTPVITKKLLTQETNSRENKLNMGNVPTLNVPYTTSQWVPIVNTNNTSISNTPMATDETTTNVPVVPAMYNMCVPVFLLQNIPNQPIQSVAYIPADANASVQNAVDKSTTNVPIQNASYYLLQNTTNEALTSFIHNGNITNVSLQNAANNSVTVCHDVAQVAPFSEITSHTQIINTVTDNNVGTEGNPSNNERFPYTSINEPTAQNKYEDNDSKKPSISAESINKQSLQIKSEDDSLNTSENVTNKNIFEEIFLKEEHEATQQNEDSLDSSRIKDQTKKRKLNEQEAAKSTSCTACDKFKKSLRVKNKCYTCNKIVGNLKDHKNSNKHKIILKRDIKNFFVWSDFTLDDDYYKDESFDNWLMFDLIKDLCFDLITEDELNRMKYIDEVLMEKSKIILETGLNTLAKYKCCICDATYSSKKTMRSHFTRHKLASWNMKKITYIDQNVNKDNPNISVETTRSDANIKCRICSATMLKVEAVKHFKKHVENDTSKCEICSREFIFKSALQNHYESSYHDNFVKCRRLSCAQELKDGKTIHHHMFLQHTCGKTNSKRSSFDNKSTDVVYVCHICDLGFSRRVSLRLHARLHSKGFIPHVYECHVCSKTSKSYSFIEGHLEHHDKKLYRKCPNCSAKFKTTEAVRRHLKQVHK